MCASLGEKKYLAHVMKKQFFLSFTITDYSTSRLKWRKRTWGKRKNVICFTLLFHSQWLSTRGRALGGGSDPMALIWLLPLNSCILRTHFRVSIHEVRNSQECFKNADSWDWVPISASLTSLPGIWDVVIFRPLFDLPMTFKIPSTLKFHDSVILNVSWATKCYFKGLSSYLVMRTSVFSLKFIISLEDYLCFKAIPL